MHVSYAPYISFVWGLFFYIKSLMYVVLPICWCIFYEISASHDVWESVESAGEAGMAGEAGRCGDEDRCEVFIAYIRDEHDLE